MAGFKNSGVIFEHRYTHPTAAEVGDCRELVYAFGDGNIYKCDQLGVITKLGPYPIINGVEVVNIDQDVYRIVHNAELELGRKEPFVSLTVPTSSATVFTENIVNITDTSFDVVLSGLPSISGYELNWYIPSNEVISADVSGCHTIGDDKLPAEGEGINILETFTNYIFSVEDYISATDVISISGNLDSKINDNGIVFDTRDEMALSTDLYIGQLVTTQGKSTIGDYEAAQYTIVAGGTGTPSDDFIDLANGLQAERLRLGVPAINAVDTVQLIDNAVTTDKIATSAVNDVKLATGAVTEDKILNDAVTTDKILNGAVTNDKILNDAVTTDKILNGAVTEPKLATGAVTEDKILNDAVTTDKILNGAVTEPKLATNSVSTDKIVDGNVTPAKLSFTIDNAITGEIKMWPTSTIPSGYLACLGQIVLIATYPDLFAELGTTYGGDGTTTFGIPSFSGRSPMGYNNGEDPSLSNIGIGQQKGAETHTLTVDEMPSHTHDMDVRQSNGINGDRIIASSDTANENVDTTSMKSTGGDQPHNNVHPVLGIHFIIKT